MREYRKRSKFKTSIMLIIFGALLGILFSYASVVSYNKMGSKDFCVSCHVMEPMEKSYLMDVHGGKGKYGIEVDCVDCHLPHDTLTNCLISKAKNGAHVIYSQFFKDIHKIDWQEKRQHRELFVYDSSCLSCHKNIENTNQSNIEALQAHKEYFSGISDKKCVSCHKNVGHKNLGRYLPKN